MEIIAQVNLTKAIQLEEVSKVSVISYLMVVYAVFIGFLLFDNIFNAIIDMQKSCPFFNILYISSFFYNKVYFILSIFLFKLLLIYFLENYLKRMRIKEYNKLNDLNKVQKKKNRTYKIDHIPPKIFHLFLFLLLFTS